MSPFNRARQGKQKIKALWKEAFFSFFCSFLLAIHTELELQDPCAQERGDGIHGGKGKSAGLLHLPAALGSGICPANPADPAVGRKAGLGWAELGCACPLPGSDAAAGAVPACVSSPSEPEHNAPFTPRQTGGLDALPAFCCQGSQVRERSQLLFPPLSRSPSPHWAPLRRESPPLPKQT